MTVRVVLAETAAGSVRRVGGVAIATAVACTRLAQRLDARAQEAGKRASSSR